MTPLVSDAATVDTPGGSAHTDANLVNPWGLAIGVQSAVWVASAGTSTSTLYENEDVGSPRLVVANATPQTDTSRPTGAVFNIGNGFQVTQAERSGTSRVILTHGDASLSAWAPAVSLESTVQVFDGAPSGAQYTSLAKIGTEAGDMLLVADFHNRIVDRIDSAFGKATAAGEFIDAELPAGFAPFGIQVVAERVYVAYAKQDALAHAPQSGRGLGLVNVFDSAGRLVNRLIRSGSPLDTPWGMAIAPRNFGAFSHALLVANGGDGTITAFDPTSGQFLGALSGPDGTPLVIDGLHGIAFGNGSAGQPSNALFFTAGPAGGRHGLYGRIDSR